MSNGNNPYPPVVADEGVKRQVLAENPDLMVVEFSFEQGAVGALHHHVHVQSTYVAEGVFDFTVGGETRRLHTGDSTVIDSNVEHGCKAIEAGRLIDTFTPRRDDFL
jgi:quercetin dioxygenase-like cupin family protein